VLSAIQLHEVPSTTELIGMVLILSALVVNALPARSTQVAT
jgi:drug/metabolite transporter (DMT)-like permease